MCSVQDIHTYQTVEFYLWEEEVPIQDRMSTALSSTWTSMSRGLIRGQSWTICPWSQGQADNVRWYPTCVPLGTRRVLVLGGDRVDTEGVHTDPGPSADFPIVFDSSKPAGQQWTVLPSTAEEHFSYYPFSFQLSDGKVFMGGSHYWCVDGSEAEPCFEVPPTSEKLDLALGTWTAVDTSAFKGGSSALFRVDRIIKAGGGTLTNQEGACCVSNPTNSVAIIDLQSATPVWTSVASMNHPRLHFYLVMLPDGKILAVGGGEGQSPDTPCSDPVYEAEMYDPVANTWTVMASMQEKRMYHSTALLLPDATVVAAGGQQGAPQLTAEIYNPPYLFQSGTRPDIYYLPTTMYYGERFEITMTTDPTQITQVSLIRLGAATHSFDQGQRFMWLNFIIDPQTGNLAIAPPDHEYLAPPGYYMLFVLDDGVPSEGAVIQLTKP